MAFDLLVRFGAPSEKLRQLILFCKCAVNGDLEMVTSASNHIYRCRKASCHIETFQLEFAFKRREYQESNCSYLDFEQSLRFSGIFPSRRE